MPLIIDYLSHSGTLQFLKSLNYEEKQYETKVELDQRKYEVNIKD